MNAHCTEKLKKHTLLLSVTINVKPSVLGLVKHRYLLVQQDDVKFYLYYFDIHYMYGYICVTYSV